VQLLNLETSPKPDYWWEDVRKEIQKTALSMDCTHVLGYREKVTIHGDVMIMSAFGTAVRYTKMRRPSILPAPYLQHSVSYPNSNAGKRLTPSIKDSKKSAILRTNTAIPFDQKRSDDQCFSVHNSQGEYRCLCCNKHFVPDVLISTIDPPNGLKMIALP
jgi:hypothetical protein